MCERSWVFLLYTFKAWFQWNYCYQHRWEKNQFSDCSHQWPLRPPLRKRQACYYLISSDLLVSFQNLATNVCATSVTGPSIGQNRLNSSQTMWTLIYAPTWPVPCNNEWKSCWILRMEWRTQTLSRNSSIEEKDSSSQWTKSKTNAHYVRWNWSTIFFYQTWCKDSRDMIKYSFATE